MASLGNDGDWLDRLRRAFTAVVVLALSHVGAYIRFVRSYAGSAGQGIYSCGMPKTYAEECIICMPFAMPWCLLLLMAGYLFLLLSGAVI